MATRTKKEPDPEPEDQGRESKASRPARPPSKAADPGGGAAPGVDRRAVVSALAAGLAEVVPGFEILDRDLRFDGGGRADLAGVDESGRLILVLLADGDLDRLAVEVLDALAFLRENAVPLAQHIGARRARTARAGEVILIHPQGDPRVLRRLTPLLEHGVTLYGVRSLKSAAGERSYLVAVDPLRARVSTGAAGVESFFHELAAPEATLGRRLVERMSRLDEELEPQGGPGVLQWLFQGEVLARLEREEGGLFASVAPEHRRRSVHDEASLDELLERALARLVGRLGRAETADGEATEELAEIEDEPPQERLPLLTPEELEAFRD